MGLFVRHHLNSTYRDSSYFYVFLKNSIKLCVSHIFLIFPISSTFIDVIQVISAIRHFQRVGYRPSGIVLLLIVKISRFYRMETGNKCSLRSEQRSLAFQTTDNNDGHKIGDN